MNVFFWLWSIMRKLSFLICHSKMLENYRKKAKLKQINVKNNGTNTAGKERKQDYDQLFLPTMNHALNIFLRNGGSRYLSYFLWPIENGCYKINLHFQNIFATWNLMPFYHNPANNSTTHVSLQTFLRYGTKSFERMFSSVDFPAHALQQPITWRVRHSHGQTLAASSC